jgi:hypothetical protein
MPPTSAAPETSALVIFPSGEDIDIAVSAKAWNFLFITLDNRKYIGIWKK